jgi:hypothetical protein
MPFAICCPSCQARLKAPDQAVGRVLSCPHCKNPLIVTRPLNPPPPAPDLALAPEAIKPAAPPPPPPEAAAPAARTEVRQDTVTAGPASEDFEVVGEADEDEPYENLTVEQEGGGEEDIPEVLPATSPDILDVLPAGNPLDELEEVADVEGLCAGSELLRLSRLFIKGRAGGAAELFVSTPNSYVLYDAATRRKVGEANEVQDGALTAMHSLLRGSKAWTTARIEVCEGRDNVLLFSVRRPPHLWTSRVEILGPEDEPLGYFTWKAFSRLLSQPFLVHDADGRLVLRMQPEFLRGRLDFLDPRGRYLGNMMTEAAYLKKIKLSWVPRGGSYYVTFKEVLARRPQHKLLLLGSALGLDLIDTESGGMRIT